MPSPSQSHQKACAAIAAGHFKAEIFALHHPRASAGPQDRRDQSQRADRRHRRGPAPGFQRREAGQAEAGLPCPGSVTAGNSSQMSDGAGAVHAGVREGAQGAQPDAARPLRRLCGRAASPPEIMGIGPIAAIPKVLKQVGINQDDLDWIELNEAFAAQSLAVIRELGINPDKVNPLGGAIALGHPLGRHRRHPHRDRRPRPAAHRRHVRHGDHVHRHRHGCGRHLRAGVGR